MLIWWLLLLLSLVNFIIEAGSRSSRQGCEDWLVDTIGCSLEHSAFPKPMSKYKSQSHGVVTTWSGCSIGRWIAVFCFSSALSVYCSCSALRAVRWLFSVTIHTRRTGNLTNNMRNWNSRFSRSRPSCVLQLIWRRETMARKKTI